MTYRKARTLREAKLDNTMTIYKLVQTAYGNRQYADFDLPKTIGYYATYALAEAAQAKHIASQRKSPEPDTDADYMIRPIDVHTA